MLSMVYIFCLFVCMYVCFLLCLYVCPSCVSVHTCLFVCILYLYIILFIPYTGCTVSTSSVCANSINLFVTFGSVGIHCIYGLHPLGGVHGEAACRQAQPVRHHDPKDHQGMDAVAQISTPAHGYHLASDSCQRLTS